MTRTEQIDEAFNEVMSMGMSIHVYALMCKAICMEQENEIKKTRTDSEQLEHDLRVTIEHYQEQASIYKGALDRKNEEIKDLIHAIESKNTRIKELEVAVYKIDRVVSETWIPPSICSEVEDGV